jgi:hypothetical protein
MFLLSVTVWKPLLANKQSKSHALKTKNDLKVFVNLLKCLSYNMALVLLNVRFKRDTLPWSQKRTENYETQTLCHIEPQE